MAGPPRSEVRRVGHAVASAADERLRAVVALLDAMPERGEADRLLDPARPRLRRLHLPRPLCFARLLFLPVDPIIVAPAGWRRGDRTVPRSALAPLAAAVQRLLGAKAQEIAASCAGHTVAAQDTAATLGVDLWPAAAAALPQTPPPEWSQSGLGGGDYAPIVALLRPLLANGPAFQAALHLAASGPPDSIVRAALAPIVAAGPDAFAAALGALMTVAAAPQNVAGVAALLAPEQRGAVLAAVDILLATPPPALDSEDLDAAADAALATLRRLEALEQSSLVAGPRAAKLRAARQEADQACREHARQAAKSRLVAPCRGLTAEAPDEAVVSLEAEARDLRRFTTVAARIGGGTEHDRILRETAAAIGDAAGRGLTDMDAARLIETLAGPEMAARRFPQLAD